MYHFTNCINITLPFVCNIVLITISMNISLKIYAMNVLLGFTSAHLLFNTLTNEQIKQSRV